MAAKARLSAFVSLNTTAFGRGLRRMRRNWRRFRSGVMAPLASFGRAVGRTMMRVGLVVGVALVGAIKHANDFRQAMARVQTMITGAGGNIDGLTEKIIRLSGQLGVAKDELAKGLFQVLSAQVPPENAIDFLTVAAKGAVAGGGEITDVVNTLMRVIDAYDLKATDAAAISDKLFRIVEKGMITFGELSSRLDVVVGVAAQAGVKMDDLFGIIARATKTVKPEILFRALRQSILAVAAPGEKLAAELTKMGLTGEQLIGERGLAGAFQLVRDMAGGSLEKLKELIPAVRALPVILAVTGEKAKGTQENIEAMAESLNAATRAFDKMQRVRQWQRLWQTILGLVTKFGTVIDKTIGPSINFLTEQLQNLARSPEFAAFLERIRGAAKLLSEAIVALFRGGEGRALILKGMKNVVVGAFEEGVTRAIGLFARAASVIGKLIGEAATRAMETFRLRERAEREVKRELGVSTLRMGATLLAGRFGGRAGEAREALEERIKQKMSQISAREALAAADANEKLAKQALLGGKGVRLGAQRVREGLDQIREGARKGTQGLRQFAEDIEEAPRGAVPELGAPGAGIRPPAMAEERRFSELRRIGANILGAGAGMAAATPMETNQKTQIALEKEALAVAKQQLAVGEDTKNILAAGAGGGGATF